MNNLNTKKIRILLVDDHEIVLLGLKSLLEKEANYEVIATCKTGDDGIAKSEMLQPDVVFMDIDLPDISGFEATKKILMVSPDTKVVFFSSLLEEEAIRKALEAGGRGFISKKFDATMLVEAVETVFSGKTYIKGEAFDMLVNNNIERIKSTKAKQDDCKNKLSRREREILRIIAKGKTNKEIAEELFLSIRTVEVHKANIMKKLNINSSVELVRYALLNGFDKEN